MNTLILALAVIGADGTSVRAQVAFMEQERRRSLVQSRAAYKGSLRLERIAAAAQRRRVPYTYDSCQQRGYYPQPVRFYVPTRYGAVPYSLSQ